jgi:Terminase small subunit
MNAPAALQPDLLEPIAPLRSRKRQRFVDEVLAGKGVRQALKAAGYTARDGRVADAAAGRLMRDPAVAAHIRARQQLAVETAQIDVVMWIREIARIAFAQRKQFGVDLQLRPSDKIAALNLLGQALGTLKGGVEVNVVNRVEQVLKGLSADELMALEGALGAPTIEAKVAEPVAGNPITGGNRKSEHQNGHGFAPPAPAPQGRANGEGRPGSHLRTAEPSIQAIQQASLPLDEPARPPSPDRPGRALFLRFAFMRKNGPRAVVPEFCRLSSNVQEALVRFVAPMMHDGPTTWPSSPEEIVDALDRLAPCEIEEILKLMETSGGGYVDEAGIEREAF